MSGLISRIYQKPEAEIDAQLELLEEALEAALYLENNLTEQIVQIVHSINNGHTNISSLPTELLIQIFDLAIADNTMRIGYLMAVCRPWRSILLSTPQLWSNIQVTVLLNTLDTIHKVTRYFQACILRSRDQPLDIDLTLTEKGCREIVGRWFTAANWEVSKHFGGLHPQLIFLWRSMRSGIDRVHEYFCTKPLVILASSLDRWRSFRLRSGDIRKRMPFIELIDAFKIIRAPSPLMETLEMSYTGRIWSIMTPFTKNEQTRASQWMLPSMPNLRHYIFQGMQETSSLYNTNMRSIETIQLRIYSPAQLCAVSLCKNLVRLNILVLPDITYREEERYASHLIAMITEMLGMEISLSFPQLRLLEVGNPLGRRFWDVLDTPLLETLILSGRSGYEDMVLLNCMQVREIQTYFPAWQYEQLEVIRRGLENIAEKCPLLRHFRCSQRILDLHPNQPLLSLEQVVRYLPSIEIVEVVSHQRDDELSVTRRRTKITEGFETAVYVGTDRIA